MLRPIIDVLAALGLFLIILLLAFYFSLTQLASTTEFRDDDGCFLTAKHLSLRPSEHNIDYPVIVYIKKERCK